MAAPFAASDLPKLPFSGEPERTGSSARVRDHRLLFFPLKRRPATRATSMRNQATQKAIKNVMPFLINRN